MTKEIVVQVKAIRLRSPMTAAGVDASAAVDAADSFGNSLTLVYSLTDWTTSAIHSDWLPGIGDDLRVTIDDGVVRETGE